jgi:hypothetical protein
MSEPVHYEQPIMDYLAPHEQEYSLVRLLLVLIHQDIDCID